MENETTTIETKPKPTILIVDDTPLNIDILKGVLSKQYRIRAATSGQLALKSINKEVPDLILLDIMMPEMDGYDVCRYLKSQAETANIPVIFVTAKNDTEDEEKGFSVGAVDYISKPIKPALVKARVKTHLQLADQHRSCMSTVAQRTRNLKASQRAAIYMLGEAGHYNDTETGVHIWRMADYASTLAKALAWWPIERTNLLELAAPMHDTGKIGIPDNILKAPRKLTPEEWEIMKTHTTIGHSILKKCQSELFQMAAEVALYHHERWDGSGYPEGLSGKDIPETARIVAIADVFDALTMNRPYKKAWLVDKAIKLISEKAGSHFDPEVVEKFVQIQDKILEVKSKWDDYEKNDEDNSHVFN